MDFNIASQTDRGRSRDINEDSLLADLPLVAVADGMGGHVGGEVASSLAVQTLGEWKSKFRGNTRAEATQALKDAFAEANRVIWERGRSDDDLAGMGTTITAAWIADDTVTVAHVGDSRAYLLRGEVLKQLTEDQNVAQQWVRQGRLSEDEAITSPQRHILLQAIGTEPTDLDIEVVTVDLQPGDRLMLATDGVFGMVRDEERLREILQTYADPSEACRTLVDAANEAGGQDNISVVIVDAGTPQRPPAGGAPVVVKRADAAEDDKSVRTPRFERRRLLVGTAVAAGVLIAIVLAIVWASSGPSYVLSTRNGKVVVLDGKPGREGGPASGNVVHVYEDDELQEFPAPTRRDLRTGIPVASIREADRTVSELPRALGPQDTPTPAPTIAVSPGTTPTPKARSSATVRSP